MARLIEVYVENGVVKGHIEEGIYYKNTEDLIQYMEENLEIINNSEGWGSRLIPISDLNTMK